MPEVTAILGANRWIFLVVATILIELTGLAGLPLPAVSFVMLVAESVVQPLAIPLSKVELGIRLVDGIGAGGGVGVTVPLVIH